MEVFGVNITRAASGATPGITRWGLVDRPPYTPPFTARNCFESRDIMRYFIVVFHSYRCARSSGIDRDNSIRTRVAHVANVRM